MPPQTTQWPIDGPDHSDVSRSAIYVDDKITTFLDYDRQPILIASKGMGKTLLLRTKKKILQDRQRGELIIPRNLEYDEPKIFGQIKTDYSGFEDPRFWLELWRACILLSILSYPRPHSLASHPRPISADTLATYLNQLPLDRALIAALLADITTSAANNPSHYLGTFLQHSLSQVEQLRRYTHILTSLSETFIHSAVYVFIDGFDQTLTEVFAPHNLDAWRSAQIGLVLAAHHLNTENQHIKVFASIRQEAFAGYKGQHREVIKGKSIHLEYAETDLRAMFLKNVQIYSGFHTIEEFVGLRSLHNDVFEHEEDVFRYIYRHSSGTPRSVMFLGQKLATLGLSRCTREEAATKVKVAVNTVSADSIREDYLVAQRSIFLRALATESAISTFLGLISSNVLNATAMKAINSEFATREQISPTESHPFCELLNIGLLGTHRADPVSLDSVQYFRKPDQFDWKQDHLLQESHIYFIHPALHGELVNQSPSYRVNKCCLIGDGYPWPFQGSADVFPMLFISHSSLDKATVERCLPLLEQCVSMRCPHNIWYDKWSIKAGQDIHQEVERGVAGSSVVLLVLSRHSLQSGWVDKEWRPKHMEEIESGNIKVISVIVDDLPFTEMPLFLRAKRTMRLRVDSVEDLKADIEEVAEGLTAAMITSFENQKGKRERRPGNDR